MPEGHTIHRLARDHNRDFVGQKLRVSSPQGRFEDQAKLINGRALESVEAYGKHLFYHWKKAAKRPATALHIHLGLYGKFQSYKLPAPEPRGAVRVRIVGEKKAFDLRGPNTCELLNQMQVTAIYDRLGPDPLRKDANPELAWHKISKSRSAMGTLLLNQAVIAGVGNVYRAEVLHLLKLHPEQPGNSLSRAEFDELWQLLVDLLSTGVKYNRIIVASAADIGKPPSKMNREERLLVYKHQWCGRCDAEIETATVGSRKIYFCPRCQRLRCRSGQE
ncbi:Fpg/Nei family DNA glycosylase [Adhaeretor mobilis]|uniref:Endonuclease 8 1 n=1 Tax=Adhaeretor mobilis TaxID=1930276 RepID=A0A517MPN0_9BACT|nr:DNA glycosylase [Adhaeretor mobilis]QDS96840.1 Endonuclease 8 1 [Adhaeretor mobilis]